MALMRRPGPAPACPWVSVKNIGVSHSGGSRLIIRNQRYPWVNAAATQATAIVPGEALIPAVIRTFTR
jgi:hypothetical protein